MSFPNIGGSAIEYAPALESGLQTVMVNAEFDPVLTQPANLAVSPAKDLVESWTRAGHVPVMFPEQMPTEDREGGPSLIRIAAQHLRSLDVSKAELTEGAGDISIKGGTLVEPGLRTDLDNHLLPYRDIRFGMYYRDAAAAHRGSVLMQERGIDFGEQILAVAKLVEMPTKEGIKPTNEAMRGYHRIQPYILPYNKRNPALQPVVVVRQMPNSYRLWDLYKGKDGGDRARQMLTRSMRVTAQETPVFMEGLNPDRPADMLTYLYERVPSMVGYSLGRLKEAGLKQQYPHDGNMSLSLSLPDADSIVPDKSYRQAYPKAYCTRAMAAAMYIVRFSPEPQIQLTGPSYGEHDVRSFNRKKVIGVATTNYVSGYEAGATGKHISEI